MPAELWIIAGPNGAGKTTLTQAAPLRALITGVRLLNPDDETLRRLHDRGFAGFDVAPIDLLRELYASAAEQVLGELTVGLSQGENVAVETVLSTEKYRPVVEHVLSSGGYVRLIYVALRSPELAVQRVGRRVRLGGHDVPPDKIRQRWYKSLAQLPWFLARADSAWVFDNSGEDPDSPPLLIAEKRGASVSMYEPQVIPAVTAAIQGLVTG